MKLSEKQLAMLGVLSPGFGGTELPEYIKEYLAAGLGGITLFGSNTPDLETTANLVKKIREINPDCIISIDEECGDVTRLWAKSGSPYPSPYIMGKVADFGFTESTFGHLGVELAQLDIDLTFGPVLDLSVSKDNPIVGVRSFGEDAKLVAKQAKAAVAGIAKAGVSCAPKHFPGHGKTSADSHLDLPSIDASLEELMREDILPFQTAITAGAPAIMVGHLVVPQVDKQPASLSSVWIDEVLRSNLGFEGVVVTDALDMGALGGLETIDSSAIAAVRAGANLLCLSGIQDQSGIMKQILNLADAELTQQDLKKLSQSKKLLRSLRRRVDVDLGERGLETNRISQAFEIIGKPKIKKGSSSVLSLGAEPTIASGNIAWGLENSLLHRNQVISEFDTAENQIVQFRDAWRDEKVLDRLMMLKANHPNAVFVDFGWPTAAFDAKNLIRAFGATRAHADAVADYLLKN